MVDLNKGIFAADVYGNVNSFRQNLQMEYTKKLISILDSKTGSAYSNAAKSMSLYNLRSIKNMVSNSNGDIASKAHKAHLKTLINNALEDIK